MITIKVPKPPLQLGPPPRLAYPLVVFLIRETEEDEPSHPDDTVRHNFSKERKTRAAQKFRESSFIGDLVVDLDDYRCLIERDWTVKDFAFSRIGLPDRIMPIHLNIIFEMEIFQFFEDVLLVCLNAIHIAQGQDLSRVRSSTILGFFVSMFFFC